MIAVASFFVVLVISLIVVRIASVALQLTGLSAESAKFQARSAWTGTGFTTGESEGVVEHPVRRRVITWLMVLRGAGLVTAASALIISFSSAQGAAQNVNRLLLLLVGLVLVWLVSLNRFVDRHLTRAIRWALGRFSDIEVRDYVGLLRLGGEWTVAELQVQEGDWLAERSLADLDLPEEGVLVLGVATKDGRYLGAPRGGTTLAPGDVVMLYGRAALLTDLDRRKKDLAGEMERVAAVAEQERIEEDQEERPPEG